MKIDCVSRTTDTFLLKHAALGILDQEWVCTLLCICRGCIFLTTKCENQREQQTDLIEYIKLSYPKILHARNAETNTLKSYQKYQKVELAAGDMAEFMSGLMLRRHEDVLNLTRILWII